MKEDQMRALLTSLLDCGYRDLDILDSCEYDFSDLVDQVKEMGYEKIDINNLCFAMFEIGKREIQEKIEERIEELRESEDSESDIEKLKELESLSAYDDIESYHNYIDTSIYINDSDKSAIYEKHLKEELDKFENDTGFSIT